MPLVLEALTYHRGSDEPLSVVVILVVRVTLVVATGWLVSRAVSRSSAAVEHRVWLLAIVGTLVVPVVWAFTPGWRVPLLAVRVAGATLPAGYSAAPLTQESSWPELLVAVWITGAVVGLGYTLLGIVAARRLFRASAPCRDAAWLGVLAAVRREVGGAGRVELRISPRSMSPAVWSFRRVQILVPEESLSWPLAQRKSVLLHELAHVARCDCASQMIANLACAAWWFHPLVWYAAGKMRGLGEQAADDHVIRAGGDRADYAGQLLAIARALDWARLPGPAQTMFHPSHLERRLRAILDPAREREALDARRSLASILIAAALMIPLATMTPSVIRASSGAAVSKPAPRGQAAEIDVHLKVRVNLPVTPVQAVPGDPRLLLQFKQQRDLLLQQSQQPTAPPPVTFELIPNWEMGRQAERLIPNYVPGMAEVRLVEEAQAFAAQRAAGASAADVSAGTPPSSSYQVPTTVVAE